MNEEPDRLTFPSFTMPKPGTDTGLASRLERRFGLGAMPDKRRALYARLQLMANENPLVELLVREAAAEAVGKDYPDRYFCKAIVLKLREASAYPDV